MDHDEACQNLAVERHVVLVQPQIHWNTGNIGRTCLGADAALHLIKPLGFSLDSAQVKRAGLDYWPNVRLNVWESVADFMRRTDPEPDEIALFTKNGRRSYLDLPAAPRLFLFFGAETHGLPPDLLAAFPAQTFRIPIRTVIRSLNLSTAVGIGLYASLAGCLRH